MMATDAQYAQAKHSIAEEFALLRDCNQDRYRHPRPLLPAYGVSGAQRCSQSSMIHTKPKQCAIPVGDATLTGAVHSSSLPYHVILPLSRKAYILIVGTLPFPSASTHRLPMISGLDVAVVREPTVTVPPLLWSESNSGRRDWPCSVISVAKLPSQRSLT